MDDQSQGMAGAGIGYAADAQRWTELTRRLDTIESMLHTYLPRPDGRPEFTAQYNLADVMAWRAAETSAAFAEEFLRTAVMLPDRYQNLAFAARNAPSAGAVLEFGVGEGHSLRWLQAELPGRRVVGFDSFEGLPEDWRSGFPQGFFGHVRRDDFDAAVELCVGWFDLTLPAFFAANDVSIGLLHVDCDLYSSTVTVLEACMPRLVPGAVVVFDEFFNYAGWQHHEARAWQEYLDRHDVRVEYLSYVASSEQLTVRVNPERAGGRGGAS